MCLDYHCYRVYTQLQLNKYHIISSACAQNAVWNTGTAVNAAMLQCSVAVKRFFFYMER